MGGTASLAASWGHNLPTSTSRNCWNCSFNVILGDIRGSEGIKHTLLLFLTRVQQLGKQKLLFVCLFVCLLVATTTQIMWCLLFGWILRIAALCVCLCVFCLCVCCLFSCTCSSENRSLSAVRLLHFLFDQSLCRSVVSCWSGAMWKFPRRFCSVI